MFYIVPKDESLIENIGKFRNLKFAKQFASDRKEEYGINYDIIEVKTVWTTQTIDEAHMLSLDIPHIRRD